MRAGEAGAPAGRCDLEEPPFPFSALLGAPWLPGPPADGSSGGRLPGPLTFTPKQQSHKLILQIRDLQAADTSEMDSRLRLAFS